MKDKRIIAVAIAAAGLTLFASNALADDHGSHKDHKHHEHSVLDGYHGSTSHVKDALSELVDEGTLSSKQAAAVAKALSGMHGRMHNGPVPHHRHHDDHHQEHTSDVMRELEQRMMDQMKGQMKDQTKDQMMEMHHDMHEMAILREMMNFMKMHERMLSDQSATHSTPKHETSGKSMNESSSPRSDQMRMTPDKAANELLNEMMNKMAQQSSLDMATASSLQQLQNELLDSMSGVKRVIELPPQG